jgi:hypothetical protein
VTAVNLEFVDFSYLLFVHHALKILPSAMRTGFLSFTFQPFLEAMVAIILPTASSEMGIPQDLGAYGTEVLLRDRLHELVVIAVFGFTVKQ